MGYNKRLPYCFSVKMGLINFEDCIFGNLNSLIIQIIIYYVQTYMKNTIN